MEGEPSWTKQISSEQVCTFFYAFAIINAVIGLLGLGLGLWNIFVSKMPIYLVTPMLIQVVITSAIAFTSALFHYLICQRALLNKE
jgi:hypothetical protein